MSFYQPNPYASSPPSYRLVPHLPAAVGPAAGAAAAAGALAAGGATAGTVGALAGGAGTGGATAGAAAGGVGASAAAALIEAFEALSFSTCLRAACLALCIAILVAKFGCLNLKLYLMPCSFWRSVGLVPMMGTAGVDEVGGIAAGTGAAVAGVIGAGPGVAGGMLRNVVWEYAKKRCGDG
jgi:hypothetical protein